MAWQMLPTDYTDAVWAGLKRYTEITNDDGTVSFQDVTQYSNRDNSFFGAQDANRMNEALNTIMSMVENGTDLYTDFQNYFTTQKAAFKEEADSINADFNAYVEDLEAQGDSIIQTIQTDYKTQIETFEDTQEQVFNTWFDTIKGQLSDDVAGNLQNQITDVSERTILLKTMCLTNDFISPLATDDDTLTVITDDLGNAIMADWKYKEV
mgnify:FL=1|jgi:hypothetical protein